jgi:hypothetical protein
MKHQQQQHLLMLLSAVGEQGHFLMIGMIRSWNMCKAMSDLVN